MEEKKKRGGSRAGAGAPRKKDVAISHTIRIPDNIWIPAKNVSKKEGKSISRWIASLIQAELERHDQV